MEGLHLVEHWLADIPGARSENRIGCRARLEATTKESEVSKANSVEKTALKQVIESVSVVPVTSIQAARSLYPLFLLASCCNRSFREDRRSHFGA